MQYISLHDQSIRTNMLPLLDGLDPRASTENYRRQVKAIQDELNAKRTVERILDDLRIEVLMKTDLYLRAARPNLNGQESPDWHRESFYGCPRNVVNVWMPLLNCTEKNSMRYIPGSEEIADERMVIEQTVDASVPRHSNGHKIGLLYAPKKIVGGIDFSLAKPLLVPEGMVVMFPGELIHGAAQNKSDSIRCSIDFRILPKRFN